MYNSSGLEGAILARQHFVYIKYISKYKCNQGLTSTAFIAIDSVVC